eukprot:TRINITY_DN14209_c2_g1_i2.p1 TRINITY_DN14209_c2_g1~~TRINITY_DN14209_c2_g1_i2.p1  ORF type:complete len:954 (-),score=150.98 TRINITY_DN14209_c2_g1_i2:431-2959(-)
MVDATQSFKRMRCRRRLQQAISEDASASVIRIALEEAKSAGCNDAEVRAAALHLCEGEKVSSSVALGDSVSVRARSVAFSAESVPLSSWSVSGSVESVGVGTWCLSDSLRDPKNPAATRSIRSLRAKLEHIKSVGNEKSKLHTAIRSRTFAFPARSGPEPIFRSPRKIKTVEQLPTLVGNLSAGQLLLDAAFQHSAVSGGKKQTPRKVEKAPVVPVLRLVVPEVSAAQEAPVVVEDPKLSIDLELAISTRDCLALRSAIEAAQGCCSNHDLVAQAKAVLADEQGTVRVQLTSATCQLLELAALSGPMEDLEPGILRIKALMDTGRSYQLTEDELVAFDGVILQARQVRARLLIGAAMTVAKAVDLRLAPLDELCSARQELFAAVEAAYKAELSRAECSTAEGLRRKLHQAVQDRKGVVRVYCRVRPLVPRELETKQQDVICCKDDFSLSVGPGAADTGAAQSGTQTNFDFDACWSPGTQEDIFDGVKDLVQSAIDGYNCTIFAFGQTGAGKTHTMYGGRESSQRGICPRVADELFDLIGQSGSHCSFTVSLTMLELYCKRVIDLTDSDANKHIRIRNTASGAVQLENACECPVSSPADVRRLVDQATKARHCRDTALNSGSSRSHVLLSLKVSSTNEKTGQEHTGKILLVDLAGSERVGKSGVSGEGLREACEINASLSALGDVLNALVRNENHIPYRNHELTQLMQDSLGGTAKTLMFVNVTPAADSLSETLMSLKFAQRASGVVNLITPKASPRESRSSSKTPAQSRAGSKTPGTSPAHSRATSKTPSGPGSPTSSCAVTPREHFSQIRPGSKSMPVQRFSPLARGQGGVRNTRLQVPMA